MGCIPTGPNSKIHNKKNTGKVTASIKQVQRNKQDPQTLTIPIKQQKPKYKKISSDQFSCMYNKQGNCQNVSKMQGPKYISNIVDGSVKVLRILPFQCFDEKRLNVYKDILNLQILQDDQGNLLVLDQYCCGQSLTDVGNTQDNQKISNFLQQIYDCINQFHKNRIVLGNLNIFSFRCVSQYDFRVRLVDFNFLDNCDQSMGHAHKKGPQVDWQVFGFILQYLTSKLPPIFLTHKIQYVETDQKIINQLLRGKKAQKQEIKSLKYIKPQSHITYGYRFRLDIYKLLRIRKRRNHHRATYYPEDMLENGQKMNQQNIHRQQTSRLLNKIDSYIQNLISSSEEAFNMYADGYQKYKRLKQVFILKDKNKKMIQLKDLLPLIR